MQCICRMDFEMWEKIYKAKIAVVFFASLFVKH